MEIELKRGLNYITGDRAYTAQEIIRLQRKLIFWLCVVLIIAVPLSFYLGLIVGPTESPTIVLLNQK